jgi:hypothetical protein
MYRRADPSGDGKESINDLIEGGEGKNPVVQHLDRNLIPHYLGMMRKEGFVYNSDERPAECCSGSVP